MEKKKKFKLIIITLFCVVLICGIAVGIYLFPKPSKTDNSSNPPSSLDRYTIAQMAIFNEDFSQNYNGQYKFSRINYIYLSKFSEETISEFYKHFNTSDTMGLIKKLTNQKKSESVKYDEILIIENNNFQLNRNSYPYITGNIFGNDDLSVFYNQSNEKLCSVSLLNISENELKNSSESSQNPIYAGDEIYITKTTGIRLDNTTYYCDAVYVYKLIK